MIVCSGNNESFAFAKSLGVGLIESTINLTKICLLNKPDFILFIGSAGSYGEYDIFDIVQSRSASNIELSFLNGDSYTPLDNVIKSENQLTKDETIVNSSNYITTNKDLAKKYNKFNIGIENMEYYALLNVAKEFNIKIAGIFVITNYTNYKAHDDFLKNHDEAIKRLVKFLEEHEVIVPRETI